MAAWYNASMDKMLDKFLGRTVWLWLPFYALVVLTQNLVAHMESKK